MATNQLVQKAGKPPIVRERGELVYKSILRHEKVLDEGLPSTKSEKAPRLYASLKKEYSNLELLFTNNREVGVVLINSIKVKSLTQELYLQGLGLMVRILNTLQQGDLTDVSVLKEDTASLEGDLSKLDPSSNLYSLVQERIERNTKSIRLLKQYTDRQEELLCEASLCRDSIREIRLELPELLGHKAKDETDKVLLELRTRVEFAQRVQQEYQRQGI